MPIRQKRSFMIGLRSDTRLFADNDSSAAAPPGYQNAPAMGAAFHVWPAFLPARPSQAAIGLLLAAALLAKVRQKKYVTNAINSAYRLTQKQPALKWPNVAGQILHRLNLLYRAGRVVGKEVCQFWKSRFNCICIVTESRTGSAIPATARRRRC